MRIILVLRKVALLFLIVLFNLDANAVDLDHIYRQALAKDSVMLGAEHALRSASQKDAQGRSMLLPNIAFKGGAQRSGDELRNSGTTYKVQLKQPLFDLSNWETFHQSQTLVRQGEISFSLAKQDLILRVCQAYFDILLAQDNLIAIAKLKTAISEQLKLAQRSYDVGSSMITDVKEAKVLFDRASADVIEATLEQEMARSRMEEIIGEAPKELAELRKDATPDAPEPRNLDKWISTAQLQNYNILLKQVTLKIAESQILIERTGKYPTLNLIMDRGHYYQNNSVGPQFITMQNYNFFSSSIGVEFNIPIFDGYRTGSKVLEAVAMADRTTAEVETVRRRVTSDVRQHYSKVLNGLARIEAYRTGVDSSESALSYNKKSYEVGMRVNTDVLTAQHRLSLAQRDLSKATYDVLMSGLRLKASAGTLDDRDIGEINALLRVYSSR